MASGASGGVQGREPLGALETRESAPAEARVVSAPLRSLRGQITLRSHLVQALLLLLFGAMPALASSVVRGRVLTVNATLLLFAREVVGAKAA